MKNQLVKEVAVLAILAVLGRTDPVYAGWQKQEDSWKYEQDGAWARDHWIQDESGWYYLGQDEKMAVGWRKIGGYWYFFNPISDGTCGRMMTGWQWVDGRCYYLAQTGNIYPEGAMYRGERTPDGYQVNDNGAWTDDKGNVMEICGKGILTNTIQGKVNGNTVLSGKGRSGSGSGGHGNGNKNSKNSNGNSGNGSKSDVSGSEESVNSSRNNEKNNEEGKEAINIAATSSNARMTDWYVYFVDEDTHQTLLAKTRQGEIKDGESLVLNFQERIVDQKGQVWESVIKPPFILEVYGPGDQIFYIEYHLAGTLKADRDPHQNEKERLKSWLETAKEQEEKLTGEDTLSIPDSRFFVSGQKENDGRLLTAAGQIPDFEECALYVIGINMEPNGRILKDFYREEITYSEQMEDRFELDGNIYTVVRFSVEKREIKEEKEDKEDNNYLWKDPETVHHWDLGDVMSGEIYGVTYTFRCIDQNYSDQAGNHRQGALFLCDSVIPADFGSSYSYERLEDGSYGYVFCPGPIVNFGESNDYKYSNIRKWLQKTEENFPYAKDIDIGTSVAYAGSTDLNMYSQFQESDLKGSPIGNQKLTGKLFVLSVDEAFKYRDWLWRFNGSEEENPQSQTGTFSNGYWLRNPMGTSWEYDSDFVYAVDLANGTIRPMGILPEGETEDEELGVTCPVGVRPAFVMPQE